MTLIILTLKCLKSVSASCLNQIYYYYNNYYYNNYLQLCSLTPFKGRGSVDLFRWRSLSAHTQFKVRQGENDAHHCIKTKHYELSVNDAVFVLSAGSGCAGARVTVHSEETEDSFPQSAVRRLHNTGQQRLRVAVSHTGTPGRGGRRILHQHGGQTSAAAHEIKLIIQRRVPKRIISLSQPVSLSDREVISRLRNCLLALAAHKVLLYDTSVLYCYEASLTHQVLLIRISHHVMSQ